MPCLDKPANFIIPVLLFIALSPGMLLTLPAGPNGKIWRSGQTTTQSVLLHGLIFGLVYCFLLQKFPEVYCGNPIDLLVVTK